MTIDKKNLVVVGCGMACGKLIEELLLLPESNQFNITVIGNESHGNYDRANLVQLLRQPEVDDFWINSKNWFSSNDICTALEEEALKIDSKSKIVITDKQNSIDYDQLIIAIGSKPIAPSIENTDLPGVFTLKNLDDAQRIRTWLNNKTRVIVIGGGLLGLEIADTLTDIEKEVTVVHLVDSLMENQLSGDAAAVLEKCILKKGIKIIKNSDIAKLSYENGDAINAVFCDGSTIATDCVIISCGITPTIDLAKRSGLDTNIGILVNEKLRTSNDNIYALGECIEFKNNTYGLLVPIYEQARTLAKVLVGQDASYAHRALPLARLKGSVTAVSMGKVEADDDDEVITYNNPHSNIYKKLIVKDNQLTGAHLVGDDLNADAISFYFTSKLPLPKRLETLIFPGIHKPGSSAVAVYWPNDVTICDCNGISSGTVRDAIRTHGNDLIKIKASTRAAVNCGNCQSRIEGIVNNTYDAVIVGAGLGGLTSAAKLAKEGRRVLVIESHDKVGGYATSFSRDGYTFDASLHNMGPFNGTIETIFNNLELDKKIEYIPFEYFQKVVFPEHSFLIERGLSKFVQYLIEQFPSEKQGIQGIIEEMINVRKGFEEIETMTLDGSSEDEVSPMLAVKYPQFVELVFSSYNELLETYVNDEKLKGLLGNIWWYFGLPPSEVAAILYSVPGVGYIEYAGGYIKGTSQKLSDSLAEIITENRGRILLNTKVNRILVTDRKTDGVITDDGEIFYTDLVISNAGANNTFTKLIDEAQLEKKYLKRIRRLKNALSAIQLYIGLDCTTEELGIIEHSFTVFSSYNHDENYQNIVDGQYDQSFFSCMSYSQIDKSVAPEGKGIINIFSLDHIKNWETLSNADYLNKKKKVTDEIINKAEKFIPKLREHIVLTELGTPRTMKRYTSNPDGSISGPSQIVTQSGLNRLKPETPIEGLYLVGSSIYPGGGYPSVISSGYRVANTILQKEKS
ncbi:MAG: FAD-dependent oxidoreductase [Proteobacteria bacterium]|nr:FAD-dependent oxidoreductase [Pseudomonadota bacterium]